MSVIYAARGAQTVSCVSSQSAHVPLERGSDEDRCGGSWVAQGSRTGVGVTVGKRTCSMWEVGGPLAQWLVLFLLLEICLRRAGLRVGVKCLRVERI